MTTIAAIRARHCIPAPVVPAHLQGLPPPPLRDAPSDPRPFGPGEASEWLATVAHAEITRNRRADGGYELVVGRRRVVVVEPADAAGRHVVVNLAAGVVRSPAISRSQADSMALRIAHNEAAP